MKKIVTAFAALFITSLAVAQEVPRFSKYNIGETGCAVYLPADPEEFEITYSEDGSDVYTGEVTHGDYNFAVICVKLKDAIEDMTDDEQVEMLTSYLDFLQGQFDITGSAGYGKGHTLESHEDAKGVIDYWEDAEGTKYSIKGWIDDNFISVLVLYGPEEYPIYNAQQMFLDGFRFPEE